MVVNFVQLHVTSLLQLDALLLVFESGRQPRTADDLAAQMYVPVGAVEDWLEEFAEAGFCAKTDSGYQLPDSAEVYELLAAVADCYLRRRISLGQLIFSQPSTPATSFADAFRFRKDT